MDQQFKVHLNLFSKFLKDIIGCDTATFSGDWHGLNVHGDSFHACKGMDRAPFPMGQLIDAWLAENDGDIWQNQEGEDPWGLEVVIDAANRTITVFEQYTEYEVGDMEHTTIEAEGDEELTRIIKHYCEKEELCRGQISWNFNGGGDSGYIEDEGQADFKSGFIQMAPGLEDMMYGMLNEYGGWEINEGSGGTFTLDLDSEELFLNFQWNLEESIENEVLSAKF